jgi:D-alanyl-D-alanine carboxypeptidase/D-alanyl-D-alanine-endopeptidase (penicillin-binding protein 4)
MMRRAVHGAARAVALALMCGTFAEAQPPAVVRPSTSGGAPWRSASLATLRAQTDAMLAAAPTLRGAHVGIVAIDPRDGSVVYAKNPDDDMRPASTMKLLTGSFALDVLGPTYRFTSSLNAVRFGKGSDRDFVGVLALDGGNNPFLTTSDLRQAGKAVVASGIRIADGDAFRVFPPAARSEPRYRDGWTVDDFAFAYAPPISPIVVDENAVRVSFTPGVAQPVIEPAANDVRNPRCGLDDGPQTLVELSPSRMTSKPTAQPYRNACGSVVVPLPADGGPASWHVALTDPEAYALAVIRAAAADAGLHEPASRPGTTETFATHRSLSEDETTTRSSFAPGSLIWSVNSPPLRDALRACWYPSDNLIAEMLLNEAAALPARPRPAPGASADFTPEFAWAKAHVGITLTDDRVADGSGMSQYDRVSPRELAAILAYDWTSPNRETYLDALPVAGVSGTLRDEYLGTPIVGRAFAKSGTMLHTSNLAGYLATKNHGTLIFAFMVDDWLGDTDDVLPLRGNILGAFVDAP